MAAVVQTLQTRWDMKEEIRVPIEKGAFISAPSSFCSIKCQGNTLLTSYLPNNDHNLGSTHPRWPPPPRAGSLCVACNKKKKKTASLTKGSGIPSSCPAALWKFWKRARRPRRNVPAECKFKSRTHNQDYIQRWCTKRSCAGSTMLSLDFFFFSHLQQKISHVLKVTARKDAETAVGHVGW